jgi:hypothetical protein
MELHDGTELKLFRRAFYAKYGGQLGEERASPEKLVRYLRETLGYTVDDAITDAIIERCKRFTY